MSDSLRVLTKECRHVGVDLLAQKTEGIVRQLLGQPASFRLDLEFRMEGEECRVLAPSEGIGSFVEKAQVAAGAIFTYGPDIDWEFESSEPRYEFCVTEIPRQTSDALLVLCGAIAIAFADCVSAEAIVDYSGVWGLSDIVPISEILSLGVCDSPSLQFSLRDFYARLPGFRAP